MRPRDGATRAEAPPPPRANPLLMGQEAAEREILTAFNAGRPAQAWLLVGPRGIGKATLGFRVARWLLAQNDHAQPGCPGESLGLADDGGGSSLDLPAEHPVFRRVASGGHGDCLTLEPALDPKRGVRRTEITVDEVRSLNHFVAATAAEGGARVVIIDPADAMNRNAANALLKTLEEPPPGTFLFLISHAPGLLPATIRSRCRRLMLTPLPDAVVADLLCRYAPTIPPTEAEALARLARGSIGWALHLAAADLAGVEEHLRAIFRGLPTVDLALLFRLTDSLGPASGERFQLAADLIRAWLASVVRVASGALPEPVLAGDGETVRRLASAASLDRWLEVWDKTTGLLARTDPANMNPEQVVLSLFLDLKCRLQR